MDRRVTFGGLHHLPLVNMGYPPLCKQALSQESVNNNIFARAPRLFVHFFVVVELLRRESS